MVTSDHAPCLTWLTLSNLFAGVNVVTVFTVVVSLLPGFMTWSVISITTGTISTTIRADAISIAQRFFRWTVRIITTLWLTLAIDNSLTREEAVISTNVFHATLTRATLVIGQTTCKKTL